MSSHKPFNSGRPSTFSTSLRRHRSRKSLLISSHPEADPEGLVPSETAIDAPVQEDFRRGPSSERPRPIVSINGSDVEDEEHREAA